MSHAIVSIHRWGSGPMGTFGDLLIGNGASRRRFCFTLELPWHQNQRGISCIPAGAYPLARSHYNSGDYDCWEICGVPGRDEIKVHVGNTIEDIEGCVVLGTGLGWIADKWAVTSSTVAFEKFMEAMEPYDSATIAIMDVRT